MMLPDTFKLPAMFVLPTILAAPPIHTLPETFALPFTLRSVSGFVLLIPTRLFKESTAKIVPTATFDVENVITLDVEFVVIVKFVIAELPDVAKFVSVPTRVIPV